MQSHDRYILDQLMEGCQIIGHDFRYLYVNDVAAKQGHRPKDELIGRTMMELYPGIEATPMFSLLKKCMDERRPAELENEFMYPDGSKGWFTLRMRPVPEGVFILSIDISERKRREAAEVVLRRRDSVLEAIRFVSEELLDTTSLEEAFDGVLKRLGEAIEVSRAYIFEKHTDSEGILLASQRYEWSAPGMPSRIGDSDLQEVNCRSCGFSRWVEAMERGETIQGHVKDFPKSERAALDPQGVVSLVACPIFVQGRCWGFIGFDECTSGREWSKAVIDALKAAAGAIGSAMERRLMEERLKKTAATLAEAQRLSRMGSWEWDLAKNETCWSEGLYQIFGVEPGWFETDAYEAFIECVHPEDRDSVDEVTRKALSDKQSFNVEYRIIRPDGKKRHIYARGEVFCSDTGEPVKVLGTSQDVTERKQVEAELAQKAHLLDLIFEHSLDSLVLMDKDFNFIRVSESYARSCQRDSSEFPGRNHFDMFPSPLEQEVRPFVEGKSIYRRQDRPFIFPEHPEWGTTYWDLGLVPILNDNDEVEYLLFTLRDNTERKHAEDELDRYKGNLEAIFRSVKEGVVSVDLELRLTEVNEAAFGLCGVGRQDIGRSFRDREADCSLKCLEALSETIRAKKTLEVFRLDCGRTERPHQTVNLNTYPLIDTYGNFSGAVLVISDETRLADLEKDLGERRQLHNIVGSSEKMREIFDFIENLADIDTTVLITGESGTGKEMVAEALHYTGTRSARPLVKVNCSAIPEHLLESELFGHIKGAFTGAVNDRTGRFELADSGTIFLDEIGDISPGMQLRLLRVIQEKEFERLGDSKTTKVNVRVIAATNKDLDEKVREGEFREDLYYRLKVVELQMPPLRERLEDLPLLEDHFVNKFNKKFNKSIVGLDQEAQKVFMNYPWPGNIRELEHAFEHAFIVCRDGFIGLDDLPPALREYSKNRMAFNRHNKANERELIINTLEETAWNKQKAARRLGISRTTLYRKIKKYRIDSGGTKE